MTEKSDLPEESDLLCRIRQVRTHLALEGPPFERSKGDFDAVALPRPDADVLRDLLVREGARVVIEVGLGYGSSALAIDEALVSSGSGGHHVVIDPHQDRFEEAGWRMIVESGADSLCTFLRDPSHLALANLVTEGLEADAAFVDGSHVFHNVFVDLHYLRELVRPGGLIVLDDCDASSVAAAARYFETNARWTGSEVPAGTRLRAWRLPSERFEPEFTDFEPF